MTTPNQSYLVKQMTSKLAACFASFLHEVNNCTEWVPAAWVKPMDVVLYPTEWRKDKMLLWFRRKAGYGGPLNSVEFTNARWDPGKSKLHYGPKRLAKNVQVADNAKTKIIENSSDVEVNVSYEESVEITNSFATSITEGMTLDVTATSETTVSGEYMGVSAEEKVTLEMGISTSKEESKEESEEGTNAEALAIEFTAKPRSFYMIEITKEHQTTYQDFQADGVMDFDVKFHLQGNNRARLWNFFPGNNVSLTGINGVDQFMKGFDTNYPKMEGFWAKCYGRTKNGINKIIDPNMRRLSIKGTNEATLESNADYKVELLGNKVPAGMDHLKIVDAKDL